MALATEVCENCGRPIGKLETAHVYDGHIVCTGCRSVLAPHPVATVAPPLTPTSPQPLQYHAPQRPQPVNHGLSTRGRRHKFVDYLLVPRMAFLALFIFSGVMSTRDAQPDRTYTIIFFCCWLALGLAKIVMKAAHRSAHGG